MRTIVLLLVIAATSTVAFAQMYKWVDKDGKTHYTDSPPPADAKKLAPPKGSSAPAPVAPAAQKGRSNDPKGSAEGTQSSFQPDEQLALRTVCGIYFLETFKCRLGLKRSCPMEELVKGVGGNPNVGLARDPRSDPNYDYRIDPRADEVVISAVPRASGLTGFYSEGSATYYNPAGAAGKGNRTVVGAINCPSESR